MKDVRVKTTPAKNGAYQSARRFLSPKSVVSAVVVIGIGLVGSYLLSTSHASTPTASIEVENGTVSANADVVNDANASNAKAILFHAGTTTPSTAKPDATNTGVPAGTALTVVNGDQTFSTNGQVISGKDFHGYVQITGSNITIKNSIFRGGVKPCSSGGSQNSAALWIRDDSPTTGTIIEDSEIDPGSNATACMDGIWAANVTMLRMNIHGSTDGVKAYSNMTMKDSYVHDLHYFASDPNQGGGGTHNDAVQTYRCDVNILVQHNNLDLSTTTNGNSAYQITQDGGVRCSNLVIDSNWLDGGGCTINVAHKDLSTNTGVSVTNNRFGHHQSFTNCTMILSTKTTLAAYSGNVYDDTGKPIPAPQVHD